MIETLTNFFITSALVLFGIAFIIGLFRLIKGPTTVIGLWHSMLPVFVIMCIIGIVSVIYNTVSFLDSIMLVAIISFVSSVSISRFIGEVEYSMAQINEIIELIAAFLIFLGSIIAVISAIGIVKFQDVFYEVMHLPRVLRYLSY